MISLTFKELLRTRASFRLLFYGQVISELGTWFNFIAGLGLVRMVSGARPGVAAILIVARLAPFSLIAPLAGAVVDRWSRRTIMIISDLTRALFALSFLFVTSSKYLWIAYVGSVVMAALTAFFEAAKNAALPNMTGEDGLLAGNVLLFSSRFLLMSIGAALGGWVSFLLGYQPAFVINSLSFLASAYFVWRIPEADVKEAAVRSLATEVKKTSWRFARDLRDGWKFIGTNRLVLAIMGANILWALGGGAHNLIVDQLGGKVFGGPANGDAAVSMLFAATGIGLFLGMILARRVDAFLQLRNGTLIFIGLTVALHGIAYALMGLMPSIWLACVMCMVSRILLGVEYGVQDTLLVRLVPDELRGRVLITDRATEILTMNLSTVAAGFALHAISPRMLTIASGLIAGFPGVVWLGLVLLGKLTMPERRRGWPGSAG